MGRLLARGSGRNQEGRVQHVGGSHGRCGDGEGVKADGLAPSREGVAHWLHPPRRPTTGCEESLMSESTLNEEPMKEPTET